MNQAELEKEYKRQQTIEGQAAVEVKRRMLKQFEKIDGKARRIGIVQPLTNAQTKEVMQYFIAE